MSENIPLADIITIFGEQSVSTDPVELEHYSKDASFFPEKMPKCVVWPRNEKQIEKILRLANSNNFSVIPISSIAGPRRHGDTIPHKDNCVVLNLSKMNKILEIDKKNRVVMVEPGVTFKDLIPKLHQKGLRLILPLHPRETKSVLTSALEREPVIIPRYQWDSSDPLLCTEVVFGTGDLFRTGTAAGPGSVKEQKKSGQAQANPMGPTQFSPFRVIQGAQGSIGIVTWATVKLELLPSIQNVFHLQSDDLQALMDFQYELLKYRLCDEVFILNNLNLACLVKKNPQEIEKLANSLSKWNLIYVLAGKGKLANDRISYLEGDIEDIKKELNLGKVKSSDVINKSDIINCINDATSDPWRMRLKGGNQDIFFIINFEKIPELVSLAEKKYPKDLGVYIQALNQGTSYHCGFDLFYDPKDNAAASSIKEKFLEISKELMNAGAFFNRPYGLWAKDVYQRHDESTQTALRRVKKIFDPNNILNPGVLCFDE